MEKAAENDTLSSYRLSIKNLHRNNPTLVSSWYREKNLDSYQIVQYFFTSRQELFSVTQ